MTSPLQQKVKINGPVVITANRLADGAVVYRDGNNGWTTRLEQAAVARTVEDATALLSAAHADAIGAVEPYIAPVVVSEDGLAPGNLRERIRQDGPTFPLPSAVGP